MVVECLVPDNRFQTGAAAPLRITKIGSETQELPSYTNQSNFEVTPMCQWTPAIAERGFHMLLCTHADLLIHAGKALGIKIWM